jgi:hypothetical protein
MYSSLQAVGFFVGHIDDALDARRDEDLAGPAAVDVGLGAGAQLLVERSVSASISTFSFSRIWEITPCGCSISASRMCSVSIWL